MNEVEKEHNQTPVSPSSLETSNNPKEEEKVSNAHLDSILAKNSRLGVVDFKDLNNLMKYISPTGKILPRSMTNTSSKEQRKRSSAIKRARIAGLMPFVMR